jgi:hypothetical protein
MLWQQLLRIAANPYNISANQIGLPTSTTSLGQGITNAVALIMSIIGGLALIFIIVGGIQMAISAGNAKRVAQARETIIYACVGLVIAIGGYAIAEFITGAVNGGH